MQIKSGLMGCMQSGYTILRRRTVGDGMGGDRDVYYTLTEYWRARLWSASREFQREETGERILTSHSIQGKYTDLVPDDRIVDGDDTYEVRRVYVPKGYGRWNDAVRADLVKINEVT